ncbi:MAG: flap endonuclease-1 [Candidatus Micrarchaeota archaeon]|nr:flap endonuclease-1 [Candidatus Micrarchaeota archaeon]
MAVDLSKLVSKRRLNFEELRGRSIAIDAYNVIYQFLSIIRQQDGTPLMDFKGNVTSHLSGIFYRTIDILDYGIRPIYVFDGIPSILKQKTTMARIKRRDEARKAWEEAKESGDVEAMRMHAMASTRITKEVVESSKELLKYMGIGYVNAPGEGEAQASYMCKEGLVYAVASQDYDTLLFGSRNVVRNLTFSGRRKLPRKNVYINVEPEMVSLEDTLNSLGINQRQLIWLGIMLGTDFNNGIRGAGPKTALRIARNSSSIDDVKGAIMERFKTEFELDIREVEDLFTNPEVREMDGDAVESLLKGSYDKGKLVDFMCRDHGFSEERIAKTAERLAKAKPSTNQKGIGSWLK